MGSSDDYCAICGGPLRGDLIAEKPRTAAFFKRWAKDIEQHRSGDKAAHGKDCVVDEDQDEGDDQERWGRYEEDHSYDQDVISVEDVQWTSTIHILGLNPSAEGGTKAFVSGTGIYDDNGAVDVDLGDDPNAEDYDDLGRVYCYRNEDDNCDAIFPFHWCCYEMLAKCITGSFEASSYDDDGDLVYSLDNELLYRIMQQLLHNFGRCFSSIDYGHAGPMQDQFWEALPGYEYLVCHPLEVPGAKEVVSSMFASDAFKARSPCVDLGSRVRHDPFLRIPYDVLYRISGLISNEDLVNLARASWPVHALLQNNDQFWRQRIRSSFLPWFFELGELLEEDQTVLQTNNPQRIFQWAERSTRPERWLTGPLMGVVNRRRIWSACEQFGDLYRLQEEVKNDASISDEERLVGAYSKAERGAIVSYPKATKVSPDRKVFWAKTWSEVRSQTKTLESFWDRCGSLVGLALTPDGQERRLLGLAGSDDGIIRESMELGAEEWIKGFVVHFPVPIYLDDDRLMTSPKGLTIILDSGRRSVMGDTSGCQMQRLLSAIPGWCITGIHGTTGFVTDNLQLTELGLVQAQLPEHADYSVPPHRDPDSLQTFRPQLGGLLWDDDYSQILGQSIQEQQALRLIDGRNCHHKHRGWLPRDLVSHGALIWAKDAGEHRALRRFTGCIVSGGSPARPCLSGLSVEYETDLARRVVGLNKTDDLFESFDIDGAGGEVVTEIEIPSETYPRALKIHTSLGRSYSWGEKGADAWKDWRSIKAPTGETLVGLVVKFGGLDCIRERVDEALGHNVMSVIGGLSMPLEA